MKTDELWFWCIANKSEKEHNQPQKPHEMGKQFTIYFLFIKFKLFFFFGKIYKN